MARDINELQHVRRQFRPHNVDAQVIVLNTGALIGPEAEAMMQALHSRSIGGFDHHFAEVAKRGAEKFMATTYVGYGHKSIGDCGSITIFIEGVSMLCAKAIQDSRLYNGQESSTRYINFAEQPFVDPIGGNAGRWLKNLRSFYLTARNALVPFLVKEYPRLDGEDEKKYEKAINARSFDIARSFLPAGTSTNLAWHGTIRAIGDHLALLRHHPLSEVRRVAEAAEDALIEAYPSSFSTKRYPATEDYNAEVMYSYYFDPSYPIERFERVHDGVDRMALGRYADFLPNRPEWAELPRKVEGCGMLSYEFPLDFGSFRDAQRHRGVVQEMPLLTTKLGFEPWYIEQLPETISKEARVLFSQGITSRVASGYTKTREETQYYIPMGYRMPNHISGGLHSLVYLAERRARNDVHPTLQVPAYELANDLRGQFKPFGLVVHTDTEQGRFSRKRGEQDIMLAD